MITVKPQVAESLTRASIGLQLLATLAVVLATFAAVVTDFPLYAAMLFLGLTGLLVLVPDSEYRSSGVIAFGLSAIVFSLLYFASIYLFDLPLSPLYLFVLAYAIASFAGGIWLWWHLKRRT